MADGFAINGTSSFRAIDFALRGPSEAHLNSDLG